METLTEQFKRHRALRARIMRRVWYAYVLSVVIRPAAGLGVLLGASAVALWQLVSLSSIIHNFLAVPVGQVPQFLSAAVAGAEFAVVASCAVMVCVSIVILLRVLARVLVAISPRLISA